ncbi:MAG: tyrosine-protein phosphatase [Anaerovibrio sp.]|uniref:tyrosine-protein phosphatase n=1 Tax=Anaerovibrio sp. TaxID=1872532 RepID=UPI0025FAA9C0|nr:tyrosine-protein phosphatase [Anaerovibrio sp.]MCR5176393.1 tyrosine-protein phosphatase [Anaerovibrio sp.]
MSCIRRRKLEHLMNFRDMGGYETKDGRITSWNRLYRSDCLAELSDDEWHTFKELNILNVIDLRSTFEREKAPVITKCGVLYHHCPFLKEDLGIDDPDEAARKFMESMSLDYSFMLNNSLDEMAGSLRLILQLLAKGNVDIFCTAGKDRTGMVAAAVLYLSGVRREDIIADYVITEVYNEAVILKRIQALPEDMKAQIPPEKMEMAAASKAGTMKQLLDWMDEHDFTGLMAERGFGSKEIAGLKKHILEECNYGRTRAGTAE